MGQLPKRSNAKSATGKKRNSKSRQSSAMLPVAIGGSIAVVAIIGIGLWAAGLFGRKAELAVVVPQTVPVAASNMVDLSWMPPETEMVVHVRVADLWNAPLLAELLKSNVVSDAVFPLQQKLQITPADIESITLGVPDGQSVVFAGAMAVTAATNPLEGRTYACVVRYRKPVAESVLTSVASSTVQQSGKAIHLIKMSGRDGPETAVYAVSPQVHLIADLNSVKAAIDRGAGESARPQFAMLSVKDQFGLAFVPRDSQVLKVPDQPDAPNWVKDLQRTFAETGQGVGVGVQVNDGLALRLSFGAKSKDGTRQLKTALDQTAEGIKGAYRENKEMLAFFIPPTGLDLIEFLANNLQTSGDESVSVASLTTSIPPSAKSKLEQIPSIVMEQFFRAAVAKQEPVEPTPTSEPTSPAEEPSPETPPNPIVPETVPKDIVVAKVDNLPEGMQLSGTVEARMATPPDTGMRFRLSVLCKGISQTPIIAAQSFRFTEIELDDDSPVNVHQMKNIDSFNQIDSWQMKPDSVLSLGNTVCSTPRTDVKFLKRAKATIRFVTGEFIRPISINDLPSFAKKPKLGPMLKDAGFSIEKLKDESDPTATVYQFRFNPGYGMRFLRIPGADGAPPLVFHRTIQFDQERFTEIMSDLNLTEQFRLPESFDIHFGLCRNLKPIDVSVEFENIETPPLSK